MGTSHNPGNIELFSDDDANQDADINETYPNTDFNMADEQEDEII